jgi:hypothetical protein
MRGTWFASNQLEATMPLEFITTQLLPSTGIALPVNINIHVVLTLHRAAVKVLRPFVITPKARSYQKRLVRRRLVRPLVLI